MRTIFFKGAFSTIILGTIACAPKIPVNNPPLVILEASEQRIIPGRKEGIIESQYRFLAVWQSAEKPDSFRFVKNGKSFPCHPEPFRPGTKAAPHSIQRGDTLILSASTANPFASEAGAIKSENTILYRITGSDWQQTIIPSIKKQPDNKLP